ILPGSHWPRWYLGPATIPRSARNDRRAIWLTEGNAGARHVVPLRGRRGHGDVKSPLHGTASGFLGLAAQERRDVQIVRRNFRAHVTHILLTLMHDVRRRSEERRVGKEGRA